LINPARFGTLSKLILTGSRTVDLIPLYQNLPQKITAPNLPTMIQQAGRTVSDAPTPALNFQERLTRRIRN
jgi:hypothetical protein